MRELVRKRVQAAEAAEDKAFDGSETLDHLCRMSGGHARNLLILLRSACEWLDDLPITRSAVDQAVRGMSNDFERALSRPEYYEALRQIDQTQDLPGGDHDQLLLYNLSVLEYEGESPCYAVNPAVKMLQKFATPKRASFRRPRAAAG